MDWQDWQAGKIIKTEVAKYGKASPVKPGMLLKYYLNMALTNQIFLL
jgi:hypothetical protein